MRRAVVDSHAAAVSLHLMALGKSVASVEVDEDAGKFGRLGTPPAGGLYVRDPQVAAAHALRSRIEALKAAGVEVPQELIDQYEAYGISDDDLEVNLVDATTGKLLAEVDVGDLRHDEPEPEPEPQADVELEAPVTIAVTEPEPELDVDSLTVDELHAELDKRNIDYASSDKKASLQAQLREALGSEQ